MSLLVWTTKATRNLASALTAMGHQVSDRTVAVMLQGLGFSLQSNAKVTEGSQHANRDAQFHYLAAAVREYVEAGWPVISIDTKKKELVGDFKNNGREYQPAKTPERVNVHDFPDKELGKAIPYGIYDVSVKRRCVCLPVARPRHRPACHAIAVLAAHLGGRRMTDTNELPTLTPTMPAAQQVARHGSRAARMAHPTVIAAIRQIATDHGVCIRPLAMRRTDLATGQTSVIDLPSPTSPCLSRATARLTASMSTVIEIPSWADSSCPSWRTWFVRSGGHELSDSLVRSAG